MCKSQPHAKSYVSYTHTHTHGESCIIGSVSGHHWITVTSIVVDRAGSRHVRVWPFNWLQSHWSETLLQQPLQPRSISADTTACVYAFVCVCTYVCLRLQRQIVLMWRFIKYKIPESVGLYVEFLWHPFLSAKHMTAVVAAFMAVVGLVAEENVSVFPDIIQSTPLSKVWLACFNINSYINRHLLTDRYQ